jgi:hypothetical protein
VSFIEQFGTIDALGLTKADCAALKAMDALMKIDQDQFHEIASRVIEVL